MPVRARAITPTAAVLASALALLAADTVAGAGRAKLFAALVIAIVGAILGARFARSWTRLITGMLVVAILVPSDDRYVMSKGIPFQLEPYRVVIGLLLVGWVASLLVDRRVTIRRTTFEAPLALMAVAIIGSELFNPGRVSSVEANVVKTIWLFTCFVLFTYMTVSLIRTRRGLETLIVVLVTAGCVEALGAILQRQTNVNIFNHLHTLLPLFSFNPSALLATDSLLRGGNMRAFASSGHPIELSCTMSMLLPLALYLAITRRQRRWWGAGGLLLAGDLASGSRTGILAVAVILVFFLCLRRRETLRFWPALIPLVIATHFVTPGVLGGIYAGFFPKGGIIAQQSQTFIGPGGHIQYANRLSRWGPEMQVFLNHNPLFGEGFGTRVVGRVANANAIVLDDQWLGTMLEIGVLGVISWVWLFGRTLGPLVSLARFDRYGGDGWLALALASSLGVFAASMFTYDALGFDQGAMVFFTLLACASILLQLPRDATADPATTRHSSSPMSHSQLRHRDGHVGELGIAPE